MIDLDDENWIQIDHCLNLIGKEIETALGRQPTANEFFEVLSQAFENSNLDLFSDIGPRGLSSISYRANKQAGKIEPGTIIGVPTAKGWHPVIYLTSNRFGAAFGIFKHHLDDSSLLSGWKSEALSRPIYAEFSPVKKGKWKVLGFRPDLLNRFPTPERYHTKDVPYNRDDPQIGEFGSAELPDGTLRNLTKEEARALGLLGGVVIGCLMEKEFVKFLEDVQNSH